jgi:hypothetical protein
MRIRYVSSMTRIVTTTAPAPDEGLGFAEGGVDGLGEGLAAAEQAATTTARAAAQRAAGRTVRRRSRSTIEEPPI